VEQVAKSLPAGWWLVVKEHPASLGRRPVSFYRRLAQIPGVLLLDPALDSHSLILRARAVVTITGTVGWEAVLYRRPVITLGDVFFNRYEGVCHVANVRDLPEALQRLVPEPELPDEDALLVFVAAVIDSTYLGVLDHPDQNPMVLDPGNVERLAGVAAQALGLG
jgi:capsule polysaccharide export protein KpsC/LpsZ